jgi:hypothetical protein
MLWWNDAHPLLRYVALEHVRVSKAWQAQLPPTAEVLAEGTAGPLLARFVHDGRQFVWVGFAVEQSNWVFKPSFSVFCFNAVRYLGGAAESAGSAPLRPGEPALLRMPAGGAAVTVIDPGNERHDVAPDQTGAAYFGGTSHVGLYRVEPAASGFDRFAVNLNSPQESDLRPHAGLTIGAQAVAQGSAINTSTPEVWRWFVGAALAMLLIEWYIYNRRVMI